MSIYLLHTEVCLMVLMPVPIVVYMSVTGENPKEHGIKQELVSASFFLNRAENILLSNVLLS